MYTNRGAVKTATNYNGDKPKRRQPERRQNGKTKTTTHLNGDNENGDSFRIRCWRYCYNVMLCAYSLFQVAVLTVLPLIHVFKQLSSNEVSGVKQT